MMWAQPNAGGGCTGDTINWGDLLVHEGEVAAYEIKDRTGYER